VATRKYGAGSVFQRPKDGKWIAQWDMPREDGRRRRRQLVADTEAQAWKRMSTERASPSKARPRAGTVGEFLQTWLVDVVRVTRRERTYVGYQAIIAGLPNSLREMPLTGVGVGHAVQLHLSSMRRHPRTVQHHAACLRTAFGYAVRKRMIDHNPAADIPRTERVPLTAEQLKRLITAAYSGMRHDIRHACATMLIENGVDLATVAAILGHSTIVITTSTYDHVRGGRTQAALGTLMERIG
jgi:hypothetical protein